MSINIEVLQYLVDHDYLENPAAKGIAKKIIAEETEVGLSKKQEAVFNTYILPLLKPSCDGIFGDGIGCSGDGKVDDESILYCYSEMEGKMLCQLCRYDKDKIEAE